MSMSDTTSVIDRTTTTPPETSPLSSRTFAGQVEQALITKFPQSKIERVLQSWRLLEKDYEHREFVGNQQSPPITDAETSCCYQHAPSYVPGLKAVAWWDDVDDLKWAQKLSKSYDKIRKEFLDVMSSPEKLQSEGNNIWAGALTTDAESYGVSHNKRCHTLMNMHVFLLPSSDVVALAACISDFLTQSHLSTLNHVPNCKCRKDGRHLSS